MRGGNPAALARELVSVENLTSYGTTDPSDMKSALRRKRPLSVALVALVVPGSDDAKATRTRDRDLERLRLRERRLAGKEDASLAERELIWAFRARRREERLVMVE